MRKIFLISGVLLGVIATLILGLAYLFMNPDRQRPIITAQFEKYTDCKIHIDDHLAFSFFPFFGVKAGRIQISSPTVSVDLNDAVAQLKLLPFLHGKIETGVIRIAEIRLTQRAPLLIMKFKDARLEISAFDENENSYPTKLSFNFSGKDFPVSGAVTIAGNAAVDMKQQSATWKNIHARVMDLNLEGELHAKNILDDPEVSGHLTVQSSNLKTTLAQINLSELETDDIPNIFDVSADMDLLANQDSFSVQTNLHIKNIQTTKINIEDIRAKLNFKNYVFNLESLNANVFGGSLVMEGSLNLNTYLPTMTAHAKVLDVQVEPLFKLLQASRANIDSDTRMSGSGNVELDVASSGTTDLLNNLNGIAHVSITNGFFMGKDWDSLITKLAAGNPAINNDSISQNFRNLRFKQLSVSFKINHGIFSSDDLSIDSLDLSLKGRGQINFANNFYDYVLQAEFKNTPVNDVNDSAVAIENVITIPVKGALTLA